jgi:hypothetical protein
MANLRLLATRISVEDSNTLSVIGSHSAWRGDTTSPTKRPLTGASRGAPTATPPTGADVSFTDIKGITPRAVNGTPTGHHWESPQERPLNHGTSLGITPGAAPKPKHTIGFTGNHPRIGRRWLPPKSQRQLTQGNQRAAAGQGNYRHGKTNPKARAEAQ